ncbi:protein shortage in chiasmata 1 ortholog isoform X1 [Silurus meridionalis]|uniref:protein shortage in chiasmata 1 ortholog isoform X1 n=1 Tax=Silurus meridionalis TaxID=175797 RepID=UPI001EEB29FD|nr:protein shortage in chiasmata 1 ortholog isoform X1 [Silurus meridionalis]
MNLFRPNGCLKLHMPYGVMFSPFCRCLLSDRECEVLENEVWVAEKHTQEVVRLLLAEPEIPAPQEHQHSLPELLSCLHTEPQCDDTDRSCYPSLLPLMTPDPILTHTLAVETHTAVNTHRTEVDTMEQFTPLTLTQIDELVGEGENMVSPAAENRDTENAVPARICKSKTVIFVLQEHDSPKRETEEKVCVSSKTSSDAVCSSARNTPTDPADVSDNKAKHKSLLKSGPKPVPYSHSQENPQNTGALSHPVRGTDTSTSLLRSTPHTVTHTPLRKENRNTFSESVTHQTGNFRLHSTHSAHKPSAETPAVDRRLSVCYTPRKRSASAQRDLPLENRHVTDHHNDPATHRKAPSPNLEHAYSNKDTATDLLQMSPTHQLSQDMTEQEHVRVQQEKKTSTTSTSHTQSFPSNHTNHLSDLLPENPSKNSAVLEPLSTPHTYEEIVSHTRNAASHTPKHQNSGQTLTPTRSPHRAEEQTPDSGPRSSTGMKRARLCVQRPQEFLDPVSSFMMLRGVLRFQLEQRAEETPQCTTDKQTATGRSDVLNRLHHSSCIVSVAESSQESTLKPTDGLDKTVVEQATEKKKNPESSCPVPERSTCETVHVPPTDTEKRAYWELHALVSPVLYRALSSGSLSNTDFSSLTPEHTRVCLKEQEKLLAAGRGKECDYNNVALLHILVTLKDLLLRCDLNTATGHLEAAHSTCTIDGLGELLRKFQVLQYLSRKWAEPWLRVQHLQEHISTWLQSTYDQKILIVIAVENVRAELVMALNQIPGNSVAALIPEHDSRVNFKNLINSRCVVVCVQHLQCGFPWWRFSTVLEFQCSGDSAVRSICTKNKINYTCFTTAAPCTDPGPLAMFCPSLDCVPFVLFITEGLLKYRDLLQLLESTYNMTLLERIHSPSLSRLGPTHLYDIITVDENTAILVQELRELEHERAAERVVLRLSALSLQFSCCWLLLHFSDDYSALVRGEVFSNLTLIYSALLLFGHKSDGLDLKVLLVLNVAEIAHCVHQVCLHTLLNSQREVCVWLEREWFSILPTEEEQFLLCFPCVNSVVAQLLLNRAPSLQWLLEASHTQLEEMFPEITPSVIKLFSDITTAHRLSAAATQCEDESAHMHSWGLDEEEPLSHTPPSLNPFCINSSIVTHTPRFIQEPGTLGNGHFGEESECFMSTHLSEEQTQGAGDFSGVGDDKQWNPSLSFTHSHTVPSTPFTQNPLPHPTPPFPSHSTHQQWRGMSAAQTPERYTERKRPGGGGLGMGTQHTHTPLFPHSKRGRLLFERVPGRSDGQTRLRFF